MNKITCYLDHARVAKCSASSGFNSATHHHDDPEGDPVVKAAVLHGYGHDQPTCRKQTNNEGKEC